MELLIGMLGAAGGVLIWAWFVDPIPRRAHWPSRWRRLLDSAELYRVHPAVLVATSIGAATLAAALLGLTTRTPALAALAGAWAGVSPWWAVRARARQIAKQRAGSWPTVIDDLVSGVRAGLGLDEALGQLADRGPATLRPHLQAFRTDLRALGRMSLALDRLKDRLADPVADRIIEALRCAHEVGGPDLATLLVELARMLRADQRTRGELEARQSWTVNGAKLAAVAPWIVVVLLSLQPEGAAAYRSASGTAILVAGALVTVAAYRAMLALGRLPQAPRTFTAVGVRAS